MLVYTMILLTHRADGTVEVPLALLVIARRNAVLDSVLDDVFAEVDDSVTVVNDLVDEGLDLAAVVEAGQKREDDLVVTHVRTA